VYSITCSQTALFPREACVGKMGEGGRFRANFGHVVVIIIITLRKNGRRKNGLRLVYVIISKTSGGV
jgi:hypothetical protein